MTLFEVIRAIILAIGWPFLIIGGGLVLYNQISFNKKLGQKSLSKLMLVLIIAWQITMYSLGAVATIFMFENVILGVKVIMPIFLIWFITMVILIIISRRWNSEILKRQNFYNQLTKGINAIANNDFSFRIKTNGEKNGAINEYADMFNKMTKEIGLTQEKLKKSNWEQITKLENKIKKLENDIYELEKTRDNLTEKLKKYI